MATKAKTRGSASKKTAARKTASSRSNSKKTSAARSRQSSISPEKQDLVKKVLAEYKRAGKDKWDTADALNKKKIKTLTGGKFTPRRVSNYVK